MKIILDYLKEREEEFSRHYSIARMLEERVDRATDEGETQVEVRHINTLKSGLLIHLYNIVEAVMTRVLQEVGRNVVNQAPGKWKANVLKEWIRSEIWSGEGNISDRVLTRLTDVGVILVSGESLPEFVVKGEPGSWDDEAIKKVANRLGCGLELPPKIRRAAYERAYRNDTSAFKYLASRRNDIAHGVITFEDGVRDLTLEELHRLSERIFPYLEAVVKCFSSYLHRGDYLSEAEAVDAE
ncbi:MAE_28990/MAE_18760 family HEPN-like nuclease [Alcanivorax xiamenensis]|uniref:MAE_28990/MAE_18760 family HEPN-like nuclease n=1 Tax=Alcanivorax xiamenensis TaxID=1177156 RepID=UPI00135CF44E|nr:MAE_28990/MAE_18760 family HEPN-like nuclease [Alcanivorax xiamenensis]